MKRTKSDAETHIVLLIDGECLLCHRMARFVCKRDDAGRFRFAALRSEAGRRLLAEGTHGAGWADSSDEPGRATNAARWNRSKAGHGGKDVKVPDSFVMIEKGRYYVKSTAALRVLRRLDGPWPLLYGAIVLPLFFRDGVYDLIARWRYRLFGRGETFCELHVGSEMRGRVIEEGEADGE